MSRERRRNARPADGQLFYARLLRLQHVRPGGLLCFLFFEGTIALAVLMALAELVSWLAVPALPLVVAAFVKINDLIAGVFARAQATSKRTARARGVAAVPVVPSDVPRRPASTLYGARATVGIPDVPVARREEPRFGRHSDPSTRFGDHDLGVAIAGLTQPIAVQRPGQHHAAGGRRHAAD